MSRPSGQNLNVKLALVLAGLGCLLFLGLLVFLYLRPSETLSMVDNANIKVVLLAISCLILTAIGVLLYWTLHCPTVRRLTLVGWRAVLVYSAIAGGFSVIGWPRIRSFDLSEQSGINAQFAPFEASLEVWPNLAVCFAGIFVMTMVYVLVGVLEAKIGEEF